MPIGDRRSVPGISPFRRLTRVELVPGRPVTYVSVDPRRTLADVIREECGQTGTHLGCEHGVCGACTVRIDGVAATRPGQRADAAARIEIIGDTMVLLTIDQQWEGDEQGTSTSKFEIIDLSDPGHPVHAKTLVLPVFHFPGKLNFREKIT